MLIIFSCSEHWKCASRQRFCEDPEKNCLEYHQSRILVHGENGTELGKDADSVGSDQIFSPGKICEESYKILIGSYLGSYGLIK